MARVWARPANLAGSTWSPSEFVNLVYHCYVTNNLILGYFLGLSDNKIVTKINHVVTHHSPTYFKDFSHDDDSDSDVPLPLPDLLSSTVEEPALFNLEITMRNLNRFGGKNLKRFRFTYFPIWSQEFWSGLIRAQDQWLMKQRLWCMMALVCMATAHVLVFHGFQCPQNQRKKSF